MTSPEDTRSVDLVGRLNASAAHLGNIRGGPHGVYAEEVALLTEASEAIATQADLAQIAASWKTRALAAEAERDRLRGALEELVEAINDEALAEMSWENHDRDQGAFSAFEVEKARHRYIDAMTRTCEANNAARLALSDRLGRDSASNATNSGETNV